MKKILFHLFGTLVWIACDAATCGAWDYDGHRLVNQVALAALPKDFPGFALTPDARERIAFLAGEPDRWRNTSDLNHFNAPDHYIDLEELKDYGIDAGSLNHFRYDFVGQLARVRAAHPENFKPIDPERDRDHTRALVGFLPWAIMENFDKLKSGFSYLKAFQEGGTPEEITNAQQNIIYIMGVMGHYVGDGAQPLHTTVNFNGWTAENPNGYTTRQIHGWIDGGYFQKIGGVNLKDLEPEVHPAAALAPGDPFKQILDYLLAQQKLVEPLYKLDKEGKLTGEGETGLQGKPFMTHQLVVGGEMLGTLWYSAWQQAAPDNYLRSQLAKRKLKPDAASPK